MKRVMVVAFGVVCLAAAGVAYSAMSTSPYQNADVIFGGGHAVVLGFDKTFSIGVKNGKGTIVRNGTVVGVTCATIEGNAAVMGGAWSIAGQNFFIEVVDNGLPSSGPAGDETSPFLVDSGKPPKVCPSPSDFNPVELDTVDAGDITVHAKS